MADLKTTNIYGDAYINNKVGINTNTPATRLQIGQLSPTAATEGLQFGDDPGTRIYRSSIGTLTLSGSVAGLTLSASTALYGNYGDWSGELNKIQWHSNNLYFVNRGGGSWLFRNSGGGNVVDIAANGTTTITGNISAANLSGTNTGDQTVGNGTITIAAGTGIGVGTSNTFTTNQSGATTVTVTNNGVTSNVAGTGISVSGATGAVTITNSGVTSVAGTTNQVSVSAGTGAVTFSLPQNIHTAATPTFASITTSTDGANITMAGSANAEGIRMTAASSATYPVFLRSLNPGSGGESSPWIYKEAAADWGIWHNNPVNSIDFTKQGSGGIANNVGGSSTNTVTVRVEMATGFVQTIAGYRNSAGTTILDNNGNISGNAATVTNGLYTTSNFLLGTTTIALNRTSSAQTLTGINIDGNAGTATTTDNINGRAFYNRDSGNSLAQDSYTNNGIGYVTGVSLFSQTDGGMYASAYSTSWIHQIYGDFRTGQIAIRGKNNGTWQSWRTVLDSTNYSSYAGGLSTGNTFTNTNVFYSPNNTTIGGLSGNYGLTVYQGTAGTDAYMTFHVGGDFAAYFGLGGAENDLVYGGWSVGNFRYRILHSSNAPYAWNMNQYVRTTDTCSFAGLNVSNTINGSVSGNAATATTLATARAINGVSFNGSADITVNGLNYNVNNAWLRENGDDAQFQMYGNSRTMIYRTDGNTNPHGGGAFAHIFYYGGSADNQRMFIINTDGRLWSTYHGWLDTMSISGNSGNVSINNLNTQQVSVGLTAGSWYTIAANSGDRASAKFTITDSTSGLHQAVHFYATAHFGNANGAKITVVSNTYYGGPPFGNIRIMTGGTYDGAMVQVYINTNCTINVSIYDNQQTGGWIIKSGVVSTTNPGTVAAFASLTTNSAQVDLNSGKSFSVTDDIYIGGTTTQYKALHANNYNSYAAALNGATNQNFSAYAIYPYEWIRFKADNGIYWETGTYSGHHIYPQTAWGMSFRAKSTTDCGLQLRKQDNTVLGSVYSDGTSIGFLDASNGWGASFTLAGTMNRGTVPLARIETITAYTILGNNNASAAAVPAALSVATVATMLSGQTMNIAGSSTSCTGNAATATVNSGNTSGAWYPIVWHSGNTHYSTAGVQIYAGGSYVQAAYFNSSDNDEVSITRFIIKNGDGYHRSATTTTAADIIRGVASGNWGINITGNAATCTTANAVASAAVKAAGLDSSVSFTMGGLTSNGTINIFPTYAGGYSYFLRMGYDNSGNYDYTIKRNGTTGFLEFNGTQTNYVSYYFVLNGTGGLGIGVSPSSRLHVNGDGTNPAIRVDNGAIVTGVASNSKTFYGFMPISIAGTTKYIQLWN